MGKIIKENGIIWFEEIQTIDGNHKRRIMMGTYDEEEKNEEANEKKPQRVKRKKSN